MNRQVFQGGDGFSFGRTELQQLTIHKDGCHDTAAWADLDGDGVIDLVGIETTNGHDEQDHELVGLHVPSGKVVWRALTGEASREVSLVNGVVVCAANERNTLRGLQARSGQQMWSAQLEDALEPDPYDFEGARAITDRGPCAVFATENGYVGAIDVSSGRQVFRQRGKLACHTVAAPGLVCVSNDDDSDALSFIVFDLYQNRVVFQAPENHIGMAIGAGRVAFFHFDPPNGTHTTVLDLQSRQIVAKTSLRGSPNVADYSEQAGAGLVLESGMILKGRQYEEELHVINVASGQYSVQRPPRPGLVFWQMTRLGNLVYVAYKQKEGTPRITITVWDANTLSMYGVLEGFGGYDVPNVMFPTTTGLLVGKSPLKDGTWRRNNQVAWHHLHPTTGQPFSEYPVPDLGCVEVHGKYLCALGTTYGSSHPVVYDTERRERVL